MNIKNEVYSILSGKYKNFHRAWLFALFLILYFFLPIPVSASQLYGFNDGNIPSGWVIGGSWSAADFTMLKTDAAFANAGVLLIANYSYFEFVFHAGTPSDANLITYVYLNSGGTRGYKITHTGTPGETSTLESVGLGFTSAPIKIGLSYKYKVTSSISSNYGTIRTIVYNMTSNNGTIVRDETAGYTPVSLDKFWIDSIINGANTFWIDDIVASGVSPSTSNSVSWDAIDYIEGGTQTITWTTTNDIWDNFLPIKIRLYQNDVAYDVWSSCVLGICQDTSAMILQTQTGSTPLRLTGGAYRIDLIETGVFSDTILATDSMRVLSTIPSQMLVNTSIPSRLATPVWVNVGYSYATGQVAIKVEHKIDGAWVLEQVVGLLSSNGYTPVTVKGVGEYRFTLYDYFAGQNLVTKMTTANAVDLPIQINISNSVLTIEKGTYYYRDTMQGYYAIDNNNWTNSNTPYIAIRNTSTQVISAVYKELLGDALNSYQQNNFMLIIGDGNELPTNKYRPGNNSIELRAFNTSGDRLLNLSYFYLLDTDVDGNKLRTSKYKYCPGEQVLILASTPLQGNLTIANYKAPNTYLYSTNINGTDQTIIYKTNVIGDYIIVLRAPNGRQLRNADFVISANCIVGTPTPTPSTGAQKATDIANLLSSNVFWSFLIIAGLMIGVGAHFKNKEPILPVSITGLIGLFAFSLVGWMPWSVTYGVVILIFVVFAWQQSDKMKTG